MVRSLRDTTERRRAQEELARYAAELEQFTWLAAHDMQEPLRTMTSFSQLLAQRYRDSLDAEANKYIDLVVGAARRMRALIEDVLAYSRVARPTADLQPTDCGAAFDRSLQDLRSAVEQSGATVTKDPLPTVQADSARLEQLFQNLLGNALKFRGAEPPQVHVSARQNGAEWIFSVRDNGIGIEPRHAQRIFRIFERLHPKHQYPGTGMGLAICKRIVEAHRGRIWVESEPGKGSTFQFALPAAGGA